MNLKTIFLISALLATSAAQAGQSTSSDAPVRAVLLIAVLLGLIGIPLGLINPRLVPGSRGTRWRSVTMSALLAFLGFIGFGATVSHSSSPASPGEAPTATAAQPQPAGDPKSAASTAPQATKPASYRTVADGAPFCGTQDQLALYLLAAYQNERDAVKAIKTCSMVAGGLKAVILEEIPSDSKVMHVDKVRIFGTKGDAVGYTVNLALEPDQ